MVKKHNKRLIALVSVLTLAIGTTFAYFVSRSLLLGKGANTDIEFVTLGDTTISVDGTIEVSDPDIYPGHKSISGIKLTGTGDRLVTYNLIWEGSNSIADLNYKVYKTSNEQNPAIICSKRKETLNNQILLYEECEENLNDLGEAVSNGSIKIGENLNIQLVVNQSIQASKDGTSIYYYVVIEYPNLDEKQNIDIKGGFKGKTTITFDKKYCTNETCEMLVAKNEMIHETFVNKSGIIVDTGYRYEGKNPKNYVAFNNELWRIIGLFEVETEDGTTEFLTKIIRDESIGNVAWDTKSGGLNAWEDSDLKIILNGQYLNGEDINYTYEGIGGQYIRPNQTISIIGKSLNEEARDMIETVKWSLGGWDSPEVTANDMYEYERGVIVWGDRPTEWHGKVGLMYPSDYGYAADSALCPRTTTLRNYSDTNCKDNNWLYDNLFYGMHFLTPSSYSEDTHFAESGRQFTGYVGGNISATNYVDSNAGVYPTIYLKSSVSIEDNEKDGSIDKPYDLILN